MNLMAGDVRALLDHLGLAQADVMGYSMGARITAFLALAHAERVRSAILGGLGSRLIEVRGSAQVMAEALEAPSLGDVTHPRGRMFRIFAEHTKSDLKALAACARGSRQWLTREQAASIRAPMLVAVGSEDDIAGSAQGLAEVVPGAQALVIEGRDHMRAVGDKAFKSAALKFLGERP
jgi:pimeloyl-ACP methyl ester carboxylesterase